MTSSGRRWALVLGALFALALPKHVECGMPDKTCAVMNKYRELCTPYDVEPFGVYLLEVAFHRDLAIAYSSGDGCP